MIAEDCDCGSFWENLVEKAFQLRDMIQEESLPNFYCQTKVNKSRITIPYKLRESVTISCVKHTLFIVCYKTNHCQEYKIYVKLHKKISNLDKRNT